MGQDLETKHRCEDCDLSCDCGTTDPDECLSCTRTSCQGHDCQECGAEGCDCDMLEADCSHCDDCHGADDEDEDE